MPTRIYVQSEFFSDIKLVEVDGEAAIEELKRASLALLPAGTDVGELSVSFEDDEDDVAAKATHIKQLKKEHGIRVHLHRCKHIDVQVRFGSEVVSRQFRPAATVGLVRLWAGHKFGMALGDIAEHVLQIAGTTEQPDVDTHIGALTKCPQCAVAFDLVPAHRVNG